MSTGKHLVGTTTEGGDIPWSSNPDGREVWSSMNFPTEGRKLIEGGESGVIGLERIEPDAGPSGGCTWRSYCYEVAGDNYKLKMQLLNEFFIVLTTPIAIAQIILVPAADMFDEKLEEDSTRPAVHPPLLSASISRPILWSHGV